MNTILAKRIKSIRIDANLSQEELAARLGVGQKTVSRWESGRGEPRLRQLKALAAIARTTVDELLADSGDFGSEGRAA